MSLMTEGDRKHLEHPKQGHGWGVHPSTVM